MFAPGTDEQAGLLLDLAEEVNRGASPERVFSLVADTLRRIFGIDRFALVLAQDGELQLSHNFGLSDEYVAVVRRHIGEAAGARALAEGRPIYIPDAAVGVEFAPLQAAAAAEGFHTVLILPFFAGMEPLGYLIMYHDEIRSYTAAEIMLAQTLAQQAAFAVQHIRMVGIAESRQHELEAAFRQRVAEAEAIDEILLRITSSLDVTSTLQSITDAAATLSGADSASIYLRDDDGLYRPMASFGIPMDELRSVVLSPRDGLLGQICQTGEPVQVSDFVHQVTTTDAAMRVVTRVQAHSTLAVPLTEGGACIGALYVSTRASTPFAGDHVRTLQRLASFARVALQNARRFTSVEEERSRLQVYVELERERSHAQLLAQLLDLSTVLNSELSVATLTERVVEVAMELVGARTGTLGVIEGEKLVFRRFHQPRGWVDFDVVLERGQGGPGYVWQMMAPLISNDCDSDPRVLHDVQRRMGFHRLVIVPVINRSGRLIGTLGVYDPVVDRDFGQRDIEALQLLAHQVAIAIENARLNETRDAFLSIVSHELKTPVTSIKGFAQVLQRRLSPESLENGKRYLDVINQQTDRLAALINDLLDLSRIQTGRFRFTVDDLDYAQLIRDVVSELELVTPRNRIALEAPDRLWARGNANRLRQVLVNLVDNAVQHGPQGGQITVSVQAGGEWITTCVHDEGRGLPSEESERVFTPYYQVLSESEHPVKGLGLGLYISKQVVNEHGGEIWMDQERPTTFCFTIPVVGHIEA